MLNVDSVDRLNVCVLLSTSSVEIGMTTDDDVGNVGCMVYTVLCWVVAWSGTHPAICVDVVLSEQ